MEVAGRWLAKGKSFGGSGQLGSPLRPRCLPLRRDALTCAAAAAVAAFRATQQLPLPGDPGGAAYGALAYASSQASTLRNLYRHGITPLLRLLGGPEALAAATLVSRGGARLFLFCCWWMCMHSRAARSPTLCLWPCARQCQMCRRR